MLIQFDGRDGGIRRYGDEDVRRLRFIRWRSGSGSRSRRSGKLLALDAGQDRRRARELAQARIAKLHEQIAEMKRVRAYLEKFVRQCTAKRLDHDRSWHRSTGERQ